MLLLHHQTNKKQTQQETDKNLKQKYLTTKTQNTKTHNPNMKHLLSRPKNIEQFKQNMLLKSATTLLVFSISIFIGTYS